MNTSVAAGQSKILEMLTHLKIAYRKIWIKIRAGMIKFAK